MNGLFDIHKKKLKPRKVGGDGFEPTVLGENDIKKFKRFLESSEGQAAVQTGHRYSAPPNTQWTIMNGIKKGNNTETLPIDSFEWSDENKTCLLLNWSPEAKPRKRVVPKLKENKTTPKKLRKKKAEEDSDSDNEMVQSDCSENSDSGIKEKLVKGKKRRGRPKKIVVAPSSRQSSDDEEVEVKGSNTAANKECGKAQKKIEARMDPSTRQRLDDEEELMSSDVLHRRASNDHLPDIDVSSDLGKSRVVDGALQTIAVDHAIDHEAQEIPARFETFTPQQYVAEIAKLEKQLAEINKGNSMTAQQGNEFKTEQMRQLGGNEAPNCSKYGEDNDTEMEVHDVSSHSKSNDEPAKKTEVEHVVPGLENDDDNEVKETMEVILKKVESNDVTQQCEQVGEPEQHFGNAHTIEHDIQDVSKVTEKENLVEMSKPVENEYDKLVKQNGVDKQDHMNDDSDETTRRNQEMVLQVQQIGTVEQQLPVIDGLGQAAIPKSLPALEFHVDEESQLGRGNKRQRSDDSDVSLQGPLQKKTTAIQEQIAPVEQKEEEQMVTLIGQLIEPTQSVVETIADLSAENLYLTKMLNKRQKLPLYMKECEEGVDREMARLRDTLEQAELEKVALLAKNARTNNELVNARRSAADNRASSDKYYKLSQQLQRTVDTLGRQKGNAERNYQQLQGSHDGIIRRKDEVITQKAERIERLETALENKNQAYDHLQSLYNCRGAEIEKLRRL